MQAHNRNQSDLEGKTMVITGANGGIGFEAALNFAQRGARVAMVCRDLSRGEKARSKVEQASNNQNIRLYIADFCKLDDAARLAKQLSDTYPSIDVLCNNAGSVNRQQVITSSGHEWTLTVNHLSGFLLTQLLLPNLIEAGKTSLARIVFTSSTGHKHSAIDFNNLNLNGEYNILKAYSRSKLMNLLTAGELNKRFKQHNIVASSFHPGVVDTGIWKYGGKWVDVMRVLAKPFILSAKQGADTLIWLATSDDANSVNANGQYFVKRKVAKTAPFATDTAAQQLWDVSFELLKTYLVENKDYA